MPIVEFLKLDKPEKAKHLCELASEFYHQGKRVLIIVVDDNQALTLDRFMWTWDRHSFLPHGWDSGAVECHDEAIAIGTQQRNPNSAQVLIAASPCSLDFMRQFEHVVDFAETHDDKLRDAARKRYAQWRGVARELRMR